MKKILRTGIAGLAVAAGLAAPAAAATVTVRVEGSSQTLVRRAVTVAPGTMIDKSGSGGAACDSNTAGGALETATGGDWSGPAFGGAQTVAVIKGESHAFMSGAYWGFDVNNAPSAVGLCDTSYVPADGDEILFYAACEQAPAAGCASQDPLDLHAPATAAPGAPITVSADEYTSPFGVPPAKAPSAGATVSGGGAAATTAADGAATLTLDQRGPVTLTVTKPGRVRDEADVCVTDGSDGYCGTVTCATSSGGGSCGAVPCAAPGGGGTCGAVPCATSGDDGNCGTPDRRPAQAHIKGIREGQRFRRGRGPRELTADVAADPSGLLTVKLALSRSRRGHCSVLSGKKAAFRHARCGSHPLFAVGDRPAVSYLLPKRLGPGRYVLDVITVDRAHNRDKLARGRNRVVFTVR